MGSHTTQKSSFSSNCSKNSSSNSKGSHSQCNQPPAQVPQEGPGLALKSPRGMAQHEEMASVLPQKLSPFTTTHPAKGKSSKKINFKTLLFAILAGDSQKGQEAQKNSLTRPPHALEKEE